jgi:hypothetical protein
MADGDYHDIWISFAAFMLVFVLSDLLLRDGSDVKGPILAIAFFAAIVLRHAIAARQVRKREGR